MALKMNQPVLVSCLILLLSIDAGADEQDKGSLIYENIRLKEEIYAIHLINGLDLTANQIDFILERAAMAKPILFAYEEMLPEIYCLQHEAYTEFKRANEENQGISPQVEENTSKAHHMEKKLEEKRTKILNTIAAPIYDIFTEDQVEFVETYRPALFPDQLRRVQRDPYADWRLRSIRETLLEAIDLSDYAYEEQKGKLVQHILNAIPPHKLGITKKKGRGGKQKRTGKTVDQRGKKIESLDEIKKRLYETIDMLRQLPSTEAEVRIDLLIRTKIIPSKVEQLEREMGMINRSKRPTLSFAARFLLNQDVVPYLEAVKERAPLGPPIDVH